MIVFDKLTSYYFIQKDCVLTVLRYTSLCLLPFDNSVFNCNISFPLQIASHPNIYVLDTPSVLPPDVIDDEVCSKLAVTGMINLPLFLMKLEI